MPLKIATWNINSVRARIDSVVRFLGEETPDVLCLQEIKCRDDEFPSRALKDAGYVHQQVRGQKGHHGVATVSRLPLEPLPEPELCALGEGRCLAAMVGGLELHNYYFPSGGPEPDPQINPRFAHKLEFWSRLAACAAAERDRLVTSPVLYAGDFNIAPGERDVTHHKRLLDHVGHTPRESETYYRALAAGGFTDVARALTPEPEFIHTWWSYRVKAWTPDSAGWRLDHFWASPALKDAALKGGRDAMAIHVRAREWERPSDHVPVTLTLAE
jgi:exodeoxyribonuclease-3